MLVGGTAGDATAFIAPREIALACIASQGAIKVGVDAATQDVGVAQRNVAGTLYDLAFEPALVEAEGGSGT